MRTTCPECGSNDIYYGMGAVRINSGYANYIQIGKGLFTRRAALDVYVCGECGYVRTFISGQERHALEHIKKTWEKSGE
jgi:predicted RNA-binding Zn-ribbon protein involved in translation (DUF1610 family)